MNCFDRRMEILSHMKKYKFDTISNLAFEFGVSERTLRRDVDILSRTQPIYTKCGRYGGGIYMLDAYNRNK